MVYHSLITEKVDVKGKEQHPLYTWLTSKTENGRKNSSVKWNFQKYLVDEHGELIDYYYSITSPTSSKIKKHFNNMFGIFKKKTEVEKLENLYKKKMKEGYDLQSIDRSASDQKYVEADQILKKIESLEKK